MKLTEIEVNNNNNNRGNNNKTTEKRVVFVGTACGASNFQLGNGDNN